jgi:single-stranded DNA-binding protein
MSGIEAAFFGTLGKDSELKTSATGKTYLRISVRVGDGDAAQWLLCTVFDAAAIKSAAKLLKGSRCYIEGRLTLNEWTAADGSKRHGLAVLSWHCRLAAIGRNKPRKQDATLRMNSAEPELNDQIPF